MSDKLPIARDGFLQVINGPEPKKLEWEYDVSDTLPPLPAYPDFMRKRTWSPAEEVAIRAYATAAVEAYRKNLISEFDKRHEQHKHQHNYWACLAREFREGKL